MSHCWGGLPDQYLDYDEVGANTNRLIDIDAPREAINAMPQMSAIPVDVIPVAREEQ